MEKAYFAGGCFWCTEAIFNKIKGVINVVSGYSGGTKNDPVYQDVASGKSDHAEAIEITFDSEIISYKDLLYIFFKTHDPTTLNRQGADVGEQYRSAIFVVDDEQKKLAQKGIKEAQKMYSSKIVTQITQFTNFIKAEGYHQDYYKNNKGNRYCTLVIDPKIKKLEKDLNDYTIK